MLIFQVIYLWGPQIILFACALLMFLFMLKAWRRTGNEGFLMLAVIAALGQIHFLCLRFGVYPAISGIDRIARGAWVSVLLGLAGVVAWWLLNKQLDRSESNDHRQ